SRWMKKRATPNNAARARGRTFRAIAWVRKEINSGKLRSPWAGKPSMYPFGAGTCGFSRDGLPKPTYAPAPDRRRILLPVLHWYPDGPRIRDGLIGRATRA